MQLRWVVDILLSVAQLRVFNLLTSSLIFRSLHIVLLGLLLVSPLVALLSPPSFKLANISVYHSDPDLWNSLSTDLRHVAQHITHSPILNSAVSDLSTSFFLKNFKIHLFHCSFSL